MSVIVVAGLVRLGLHIDGHVGLYPYLAMCDVSESCEFNSYLRMI